MKCLKQSKIGKNIRIMSRNNIFVGETYYAQFAQVTPKRLLSHMWITNTDIMADYLGLPFLSVIM